MSEERRNTDDPSQEARRLIDFRILSLERDRDDQEMRLRRVEGSVVEMNGKLDTTLEKVEDIREYLKGQNAGGWRNFWTAVIGIVVVVITVITSHIYFK